MRSRGLAFLYVTKKSNRCCVGKAALGVVKAESCLAFCVGLTNFAFTSMNRFVARTILSLLLNADSISLTVRLRNSCLIEGVFFMT